MLVVVVKALLGAATEPRMSIIEVGEVVPTPICPFEIAAIAMQAARRIVFFIVLFLRGGNFFDYYPCDECFTEGKSTAVGRGITD
jgi:hypothetical protein